jgi:scyllo-inositol 2-dehydrogenase (NADP+)
VRTGLIGLGNSGYFYHCRPHLEASDSFDLVAVCARDKARVLEVAERTAARAVTDWREVVADSRIELVVISTPHSLHYEMARAAVVAGKHVLVEKPMTISTAEADDLIDRARRAGVVLAVHQQRRFEHDFVVLCQLVGGGVVGDLWKVDVVRTHRGRYRRASADRPHAGESVLSWPHEREFGGGISWLVGPHPVDQVLELVGGCSCVVRGHVHVAGGDEVEDFIGIDMECDSGVLGRVEVYRHAGIAPARFAVYGSEGTIVGRTGRELEVSPIGREPFTVSGFAPPSILGDEIYDGVYAAIRGGRELAVKPEEARDAVEVLELALASALEGGKAMVTSPRARDRYRQREGA